MCTTKNLDILSKLYYDVIIGHRHDNHDNHGSDTRNQSAGTR